MAVTLGFVLLLAASLYDCEAELSFASYYGDNMVLQQAPQRAVVWGYAPEGAQVTLYVSGPTYQKSSPVTATNRIWRITVDPTKAGGPYDFTAVVQNSSVTIKNVMFGDVWLCGGQSNMWLQTSKIFNASEEIDVAAKFPNVRIFMASLNLSQTEQSDLTQVDIPWSVPPTNVANFSAVCWLFGRYLYEKLQYPIGLVESCWGGTPVEVWSSSRALQQCGLLEQANSGPKDNSVLWNAMIHPLLNMTIKGAIWYQGEANANYHQEKYNCSFPAMIDDWRMSFHQGSGGETALDFPFGFVQLSTYQKGATFNGFPEIRWHQTADFGFAPNPRMKNTFMAVALDLPDSGSPYGTIHPRDKQDVAFRLTLGARAVAYNEKNVHFSGPFPIRILSTVMYVSVEYDQNVAVRLSKDVFEVCCSGNETQCGPKSRWVSAPIMYWGLNSVRLFTGFCLPGEVTALRYAWTDWPCDFKACPVYSSSGILPAPPFIAHRPSANGKSWSQGLISYQNKEGYL